MAAFSTSAVNDGCFRPIRAFVVLELSLRNAKRAGVLADLAVDDLEVSSKECV